MHISVHAKYSHEVNIISTKKKDFLFSIYFAPAREANIFFPPKALLVQVFGRMGITCSVSSSITKAKEKEREQRTWHEAGEKNKFTVALLNADGVLLP